MFLFKFTKVMYQLPLPPVCTPELTNMWLSVLVGTPEVSNMWISVTVSLSKYTQDI